MARKILLADDSVTAQNMGRKILADAGYEVITVNNGSAALKKIAELKPDLIVLDVYMPGYSGLEVCQRLKEAAETARIPVLLTVGKLEPFKPEEAKRVRAEGFIVKPFEASELLSALSKLEDKIVPRSEPSKPGRFARAMAAVEESGREPVEEDSGWKSRIGFPSKKKKKDDDESGEVAAGAKPATAKPVETAPVAELPKDVTAEEMAALAAAAAQVQAAAQSQPPASEVPVTSNIENAAAPASVAEVRHDRRQSDAKVPDGRVEAAQLEQAKLEVAQVEAAKLEAERLEAAKAEAVKAEAASAPAATFAAHKVEEKVETAEAASSAPGNHAQVIAALASLEPANGQSWDQSHSGTGHGTLADAAAVSSASFAGTSTRWTAVPTALDAAESAISLELEMQKAYAAFAAAEANQPGFVTPASTQTSESAAPLASASQVQAVVEEAPVAQNQNTELAQVAEPVGSAAAELAVAPVAEATSTETQSNEMSVVAPSNSEPQTEYPAQPEVASAPANETSALPEAPIQIPEPAPVPEIAELVQAVEARIAAETQPVAEVSASEPEQIAPPVSEFVVAEPAVAAAPEEIPAAQVQPAAVEGAPDESNIHAATAAAWANWRQVRESGSSRPEETSQQKNNESSPSSSSSDEAAMAVAAGAETSPDASALPEPDHIASMVESVLAGLRPKIAAEISKKLGEKK